MGDAAGAMEHTTNKVGGAGSNVRNKMQHGESRQAALRKMGVRKWLVLTASIFHFIL